MTNLIYKTNLGLTICEIWKCESCKRTIYVTKDQSEKITSMMCSNDSDEKKKMIDSDTYFNNGDE